MAFEQLLDAATELLRRRMRLTHRGLQRQFSLDDETLRDLVHELTRGQRVARIEDGEVLVWQGSDAIPPERRQLTVMFCDLVGSTRLAAALDPEDLREVIQRYQAECAAVLVPLGGHIAQYLGDGILVYFGYPQAHEDDAERAARAGLAVVQAVKRLSAPLRARYGIELAARVGLHSGVVVIGDIGDAQRRETLALGEAPNLAAHIQARAPAQAVVASEDTARLLPARLQREPLPEAMSRPDGRPLGLWRIVGHHDGLAFEARVTRPLVDPQQLLPRLREVWQAAVAGDSQALLLQGEPGLGKTRLADELRAEVRRGDAEILVLRSSAFHRHTPLHPFSEAIARRAGLDADSPSDEVRERLRQLQTQARLSHPQAAALLTGLVAPSAALAGEATTLTPAELMQGTQAVLVEWLGAAAQRGPLLLVCEDLHWADASTLALLQRLLTDRPLPRTLVLMTARRDFIPPWPATCASLQQLQRMPAKPLAEVVKQLPGATQLSAPLLQQVVDAADGVPLYAEEIGKVVIASADAAATGPPQVPASLQASLTARLDRLGAGKPLAQAAALLGREFSLELLAAVTDLPVAELAGGLQQLVQADLLRRRGAPPAARYAFRHALLQQAAADSMLRSERRALHRRIAAALQQRFPARVEAEPETLARHLVEAGESLRAIPWWQQAGDRALARSALPEAIAHLEAGLQLLPAVPDEPSRQRVELALQLRRASALRAVQGIGAPATGQAYTRCVALARSLNDPSALSTALNGLYACHMVRGECTAAREPAAALLQVAELQADPTTRMIGHRAVGAVAFHLGEIATAREHLERAVALYDPAQHAPLAVTLGIDHKVIAGNFLALTLFVMGEDEAALARQREGLAHAEVLDHAHSKAQALVFGCVLLALLGEWAELAQWAERAVTLSQAQRFALMEAGGRCFLGAARSFGTDDLAEAARGLEQMQQAAHQWWSTGARNYRSFVEVLMARAHARLGRIDPCRALLQDARQGVEQTGERWAEPELWRAEGELLRGIDGEALSLHKLRQALAVAEAQGARGWVRRARASLAARELLDTARAD